MIIADENINSNIINAIRNIDINVFSIREHYTSISNEKLIKLSINSPRIIITEDKDFGEWILAHNIRNINIILL